MNQDHQTLKRKKVLCPVCQVVGFPLHRCPHIVVHMNFHSALFVYQNSQGNGILHHLLKVVFSLKEPKVLLREEGEQKVVTCFLKSGQQKGKVDFPFNGPQQNMDGKLTISKDN